MGKLPYRLKELRKEKRLQQQEVASAVGIGISTYQQYEYGRISPKQSNEAALANFFGVSVKYLRGDTDDRRDRYANEMIITHGEPINSKSPSITLIKSIELATALMEMSKLHDDGKLTDEEFQEAKRQILSN